MRVVFDAQLCLTENSISRYLRSLIDALCARSDAPEVVLLVQSPTSPQVLRARHAWMPQQAELVVLPGTENLYQEPHGQRLHRLLLRWPAALARLQADVFHCQNSNVPRPMSGCRIVTTLHDVFQWVPRLGRSRSPLGLALERLRYRIPACIVSVSEHTRQDFMRYVDPHPRPIQVVHHGVDPSFSALPGADDEAVLGRHGLEPQQYLLYVGDLQPRKDVPTLLSAYARASRTRPAMPRLAIAGGGWSLRNPEATLAAAMGLSERAAFLGRVPDADLPVLYRNARLFVFPSLYEGFGLPVLEAMACGTPVATTRISSLPEVAGEAASYFEPGDADGLTTLLESLPFDTERLSQLRTLGLARSEGFRWSRTAECVLQVYRNVVVERIAVEAQRTP